MLATYHDLIEKVRKICRMFRKSPVRNDDFLQVEVRKDLNKEVKAILDCKTRWYSLLDMIRRFLKIHEPIKRALLSMVKEFDFSESDLQDLQDLSFALEPLKGASLESCKYDANLWSNERTLEFAITELRKQSSNIARSLLESLIERIKD